MTCHSSNCAIMKKSINTVRLLAADAVQKAKSGHPGMPMGAADYAFTLWNDFLRFDPGNPGWLGRDRFVLSAGHGSTLLYSLLHLFGYAVTLDDLKTFRQFGSVCAGHPEFGHTPGVEVTTGPLGSGLASAVGMAIAQKMLRARLNAPEKLFDQKVYVISGDGCLMEGTTHEACALAGHLQLDNLILFYDSNRITIEGSTDIAMTEDVAARFQGYGWNVLNIDGQSVRQIRGALQLARVTVGKPTIIIGKTTIGFGAATTAGTAGIHGAPLGEEELTATHQALGFDPESRFVVPEDVRDFCNQAIAAKKTAAKAWNEEFDSFRKNLAPEQEVFLKKAEIPADILKQLAAAVPEKATATRASSGTILQKAAQMIPHLVGGAADLAPSTKTYLKGMGDCVAADWNGRNLHYGVRELAMGFISNGLALSGFLPFSSTFMVFSDYMKPALRLAALMKLHEIYVFTHDSFQVGEDGPTHQPIEQLLMFRSIPGLTTIRPAESNEVAGAWAAALQANGPVVLALTRQTVQNLPAEARGNIAVDKGAYVVSSDDGFEAILIGTGSELGAVMDAAEILRKQGRKVRVVSMPSWELFDKQPAAYREAVLPAACQKRISVEAGSTLGWQKYIGSQGLALGLDAFGLSAPAEKLQEFYGFTGPKVAEKVLAYL